MTEKVNVFCSCGCGKGFRVIFRFDDEDDFVGISTVIPGFFAKQSSIFNIIRQRFKAAWFMLRGKEYCLHDIVLTKKQWVEFAEAANAVGKVEHDG